MVTSNEEMSDSEIIQLLSEYNFTTQEMSLILKDIKQRDFESVLNYIENYRKNQGTWESNDKEKMREELRKRNNMQKMEEERKERYKSLLREKIASNRREQQIREEQENKSVEVDDKPVCIDADVKVRILMGDNQEMYLGFESQATVEELYERVASELGQTSFELLVFGIGSPVLASKKLITDEFQSRSVMLEMNTVAHRALQ